MYQVFNQRAVGCGSIASTAIRTSRASIASIQSMCCGSIASRASITSISSIQSMCYGSIEQV